MARRRKRPAGLPTRPGQIMIRMSGHPGIGRTTLFAALRLLVADAGGEAEFDELVRGDPEREEVLFVRLDKPALAELRDWMADEPA